MSKKLIITCAITGAETTKEHNPALPTTPDEQADAAYECWKAGASIIHLHVRNKDGKPSQSVDLFSEVITKIKKKCPVIVQISTGGAVGEKIEKRAEPLDLKPEMASLNIGSINFGNEVFLNEPEHVEYLAQKMKTLRIKPEIEVYDLGMFEFGFKLIKKSILEKPAHFQFVLGTTHGISGEPRNLIAMAETMNSICAQENLNRADFTWTAAGIGKYQLPVAAMSIVLGGHVRVGLEDNVYWSKGVLAKSNAQLVERVKQLAELLQRPVATVDETKEILNLNS